MTRNLTRIVVAACVVSIVGACTGQQPESEYQPSLEWVECPADVDITFLYPPECGYLTVPADRSSPDDGQVRLLIARVEPVGVEPANGSGTGGLHNIGDPLGITGDIQTGATRGGGVSVITELRGAGPHSEPSLRCPEIDALDRMGPAAPTADPDLTAAFVDAVAMCRERLRSAGIDPADFDVRQTAEDLEDLRRAVGVERWQGIDSQGTASRYLFEYLRNHPDAVEEVYLDSPWFPEVDDVTGGVLGTRAALRRLFDACSFDPACQEAYPDLEQSWRLALDRLTADPIEETYQRVDGTHVEVFIDAGKLLRVARYALGGDGPENLTRLPQIVTAASQGQASPDLLEIVASDPIFCTGYRPLCAGQDGFSHGVFLTTLCRDQVPFIDQAALTEAIDGDPVYEDVFASSPYLLACDAWDVPPPDDPTVVPADIDLPTLMLPGQFDSYSPPEWAAGRSAGMSLGWSVEIPAMTHNTVGFSACALDTRAKWAKDPIEPPDYDICATVPPLRFVVPDD